MAERAQFSQYGELLPTRRKFPVMVRITAYVIAIVTRCRIRAIATKRMVRVYRDWAGKFLSPATIWFSAFPVIAMNSILYTHIMKIWVETSEYLEKENVSLLKAFAVDSVSPMENYLYAALLYYFRLVSLLRALR